MSESLRWDDRSEPIEYGDLDIEVYKRALRACSINRYVVLSASNTIIDTEHLMPGDHVLSDAECDDMTREHVLTDERRINLDEGELDLER